MAHLSSLDPRSENETEAVLVFLRAVLDGFGQAAPSSGDALTLTELPVEDDADLLDAGWRWSLNGTPFWGIVGLTEDYGGYICALDDQGETPEALMAYAAHMLYPPS